MTLLYRMAPDESDTGRLTLWTTDPDRAELLAEWEIAPNPRPTGARLYQADVDLKEHYGHRDIAAGLRRVDRDYTPKDLLRSVETYVQRDGCRWVQLRRDDAYWYGAVLYLGDEPIRVVPAPRGGE